MKEKRRHKKRKELESIKDWKKVKEKESIQDWKKGKEKESIQDGKKGKEKESIQDWKKGEQKESIQEWKKGKQKVSIQEWKKGKQKESIQEWKKERNEGFEYWKGLKMKRRSEVKAEWMNTSVWYIVTLISYLISGWQAGLNMEEEGDEEKGGVHMDQ